MFYQKLCYYYGTYYKIDQKDKDFSLDKGMLASLGVDQTKVYWNTNIDITKLAGGVSCSYICIFISCGSYVVL
jgi:hypothetical protein